MADDLTPAQAFLAEADSNINLTEMRDWSDDVRWRFALAFGATLVAVVFWAGDILGFHNLERLRPLAYGMTGFAFGLWYPLYMLGQPSRWAKAILCVAPPGAIQLDLRGVPPSAYKMSKTAKVSTLARLQNRVEDVMEFAFFLLLGWSFTRGT